MAEYKIYIHGFWDGFLDCSDVNNVTFFKELFSRTKLSNYTISHDINESNVLFESVFENTLVHCKKWDLKIHYSGEPRSNNSCDYDIVLDSEETKNNMVDLPLFPYYLYNVGLDATMWNNRPIMDKVPTEFCCFIVSNGRCQTRNKMFQLLNSYKKVHSYGNYANNMGSVLKCNYWSEEYRKHVSNYKFVICFENTKKGTYITEKLMNAYLSNVIPIYWGTNHVENLFNMDSMLFLKDETDHSFNEIFQKIVELDKNDAKYLEFINRPIVKKECQPNWDQYSISSIAKSMDAILEKNYFSP